MFWRSQKKKDEMRIPPRVQQMHEEKMFKVSKANNTERAKELFNTDLSKLEIARILAEK